MGLVFNHLNDGIGDGPNIGDVYPVAIGCEERDRSNVSRSLVALHKGVVLRHTKQQGAGQGNYVVLTIISPAITGSRTSAFEQVWLVQLVGFASGGDNVRVRSNNLARGYPARFIRQDAP